MARNTRTFSDIDLNFIPTPMALVVNSGIGLLTASTSSDLVTGTRIWTPVTDVIVGQEFFWNYQLYRVTKAGTTGSTGLTGTRLGNAEVNGDAVFVNTGARPTDAAVTNFERYDMLYRNLYCNGLYLGKVKATIDQYTVQLYTNARNTVDQQPFTYTNPADLVRRYDENSVKAAVKNLILTNNYERPFHPELGSQVNNLLFEPASPLLKAVLEKTIRQLIDNHEPRVSLTSVGATVNPDNNSVNVTINFTILNTQTPQFLNLVLERTR
jgi:phage baseplate assembly protein W